MSSKFLIRILLVAVFPICTFAQSTSGYRIDVNIKGLSDSTIFLAYHFGDKQYLADTAKLDKNGSCFFAGKAALPTGIYLIVLPGKRYFEVLVSDDQYFSANCTYPDFSTSLAFDGSQENTSFLTYQKTWMNMQQEAAAISKRLQNNKADKDSTAVLSTLQIEQEKRMKNYLASVVKQNEGTLLSTLVKSLIPVEIPEFTLPENTPGRDSLLWLLNYNYNKDHFFDNIDLADEKLLRTPILYARLNTFFTQVVIQAPDSINKEIDKLIKQVEGNYKIFQFTAVYLFNHFRESDVMGHDAVMVKLADDIYLTNKADWVTKEFREDLKRQIDLIRPNLIGKTAHNLIMNSYKGIFVSLEDVEKDFTILYFWEPTCGHCQEATPKLKDFYNKPRDYSLEVFAVCTTDDKDKWSKYIEDNNLTWINGWDPQRNSRFDLFYNVQSTPMVYILDRNKKIIAKKLAVEEIGSFIDNYRKMIN
ncbi:MAG TPA: thioredoxin-like domain-containing protein [Bacteroidales bacterium]|nr:thioredoxin-like domain-containing protein [Bacteroidales bacterium]